MTSFAGEVHPKADLFPMLDDESVKALAEDIATNGQRHPIILSPDGVLLDGRNRLRACEIAGIEPVFEVVATNGDESVARLIASENLQTRDLTQGQKAMIAIRLFDSNNQDEMAGIAGVSRGQIARSYVIAEYAPHLVAQVIAGAHPHQTAYDKARAAKEESAGIGRKMRDLQTNRPDLAELVAAEKLTLDDALTVRDKERAEAERRDREDRDNRARRNAEWHQALATIEGWQHPDAIAELRTIYQPMVYDYTPPEIHRIAELLHEIANQWEQK